jgi:hypothetical protein
LRGRRRAAGRASGLGQSALRSEIVKALRGSGLQQSRNDIGRTAASVIGGLEPATFRAYEKAFEDYAQFIDRRRGARLPASAPAVTAYLVHLKESRATYGALTRAHVALQYAHRACAMEPPPGAAQWALVLRDARKLFVKEVRRMAELTPEMVRKVMGMLLHDTASEADAKLGLAIALGFGAGGRFSDISRTPFANFKVSSTGLDMTPDRRKGSDFHRGNLRSLSVARIGGRHCIASHFVYHKARFGWHGQSTLIECVYATYLKRYRAVLQRACGLTAGQAAKYGTHSGRRGAAHTARAGGAATRSINAFAGVSSDCWEDVYADGMVPAERTAVSKALMQQVSG